MKNYVHEGVDIKGHKDQRSQAEYAKIHDPS